MNSRLHRFLSSASALAAVLALFISIRSCQVSNDALALAGNEYIQERTLILTAKFSESNDGITLKPINGEITLLKGGVTFPPEIYSDAVPISASGDLLRMGGIIPSLQNYISKRVPREKGMIKVQSSQIPVIVETYYAAKGDTYTDKSLYFLGYDAFVYEDAYKSPSIHFRDLVFALRETNKENEISPDDLNKIINNQSYVRMPYGPPSTSPKK